MSAHPVQTLFAGLACLEARLVNRPGFEPARGEVVLPGEPAIPDRGTLALSDGASRLDIPGLLVTRVEVEEDGRGGALTRVSLADRRATWHLGEVSGRFNVLRADRRTFEPETLDAGAPHSWQSLVTRCLLALGETPASIRVPALDVPARDLVWRSAPARDALADLLRPARAMVTLSPAGDVVVSQPGVSDVTGSDAPAGILLSRTRVAAGDALLPARISVIGGPTLREEVVEGTWEPVCLSDGAGGFPDGAPAPLADVLSAWGINDADARRACLVPGGFDALATGPDDATRKKRAALLSACAWRWYRVPEAHRRLLPFLPRIVSAGADGRPAGVRVEHTRFRRKSQAPARGEDPFENVSTPEESPVPFTLDRAAGIIRFAEVTGTLEPPTDPDHLALAGRTLAGPAKIRATVAYRVPAGDSDDAYRFDLPVPGAGASGAGGRTLIVPAPDLVLRQSLTAGALTDLNRVDLDQRARARAEAVVRSLQNPEQVRETYAGAHALAPSQPGASVEWNAGTGGLVTRVTTGLPPGPRSSRFISADFPRGPEAGRESAPADPASAREPANPPANAFAIGPLVVRVSGTASGADSVLLAEATGRDALTGALSLDSPGPWRYPFFADRTASGAYGGWHESLLVRVQAASSAGFTVRDVNPAGEFACGAVDIAATAFPGESFAPGDLALLRNTHDDTRVLMPVSGTRLVVDHVHAEASASGLSTPVRRALADGTLGDSAAGGDLDDLFIVTADPDNAAAYRLALFLDDPGVSGASGVNSRMMGVAGGEGSGAPYGRLGEIVTFLHADRRDNQVRGMGLWASAYFSVTTDSVNQGPLLFEPAAFSSPLIRFGDVGNTALPRLGGRLVWNPDDEAWEPQTPLALGTGETGQDSPTPVARSLAGGGAYGTLGDVFTVASGPGNTRLDLLASAVFSARPSAPMRGALRFNATASAAGSLGSGAGDFVLGEMIMDAGAWRPAVRAGNPGQYFVIQPSGSLGAFASGGFRAHRYLASSHAGLGASGALSGETLFNAGDTANLLASGDLVFATRIAGKWMSNVGPGIVGAGQ